MFPPHGWQFPWKGLVQSDFRRVYLQNLETADRSKQSDNNHNGSVREGIPPAAFDTSIAIGVVTDLGASDMITAGEAPSAWQ